MQRGTFAPQWSGCEMLWGGQSRLDVHLHGRFIDGGLKPGY